MYEYDKNVFESDDRGAAETQDASATSLPLQKKMESADNLKKKTSELAPLHKAKKVLETGKRKLVEQTEGLKIIIGGATGFATIITLALVLTICLGEPEVSPHGGVSTGVPGCSDVGVSILKKGGSAVDAAIAAAFCMGVVNPHHSGIGGGGFMLIHDHRSLENVVLDFRETAPNSASKDMFNGAPEKALKGEKAAAVPGEVRGLAEAHKLFGKLPWHDLVQPAADMAKKGFSASENFVNTLQTRINITNALPRFIEEFTVNGKLVKVGQTMKRPQLAETLAMIASGGADAFYSGKIADSIVQAVHGRITKEDLENYKAIKREPIKIKYQGNYIVSVPSPAGGPVLLSIMNIMDNYNLTSQDINSSLTYHRLIEAFKFSYAQQASLGDPFDTEFADLIKNTTDMMLSKEITRQITKKIKDHTANSLGYYKAYYSVPYNRGTSHVSVIDNDELMVSATLTINTWFGSQVVTSSGILLNNEMGDFSIPGHSTFFDIPPSPVNFIKPGKRPLSSVVPVVVHSTKKPCGMRIAIGGTNGSKTVSGISQVLVNLLNFDMDLVSAISAPRLHDQLFSNQTDFEYNFNPAIVKALSKMGHNMVRWTNPLNVVQAVLKEKNTIQAFSDKRKGNFSSVY